MKKLGLANRLTRLTIAAAIAVLYFTGIITGTLAIVFLIVGAVMLLTSLLNYCPMVGFCPRDVIKGWFAKKSD